MNKRVAKKKLDHLNWVQAVWSNYIFNQVADAYTQAQTFGLGRGYIRWRFWLKRAGIRKRDCIHFNKHW